MSIDFVCNTLSALLDFKVAYKLPHLCVGLV